MREPKTYRDRFICPKGHGRTVVRRTATAGKRVTTYCCSCMKMYPGTAGEAPPKDTSR